jgi:hypothetical protein
MIGRARGIAIAVGVVVAACGSETRPSQVACERPEGCVRADRVGGTCQCLEWQVVSVEPVPVKFVVVGVLYAPLGNQSQVAYGFTPPGADPLAPSADLGARWRSVVRTRDGSEIVATVGPGDLGHGIWGPLTIPTATSASLAQPTDQSLRLANTMDVHSHASDQIFVWINPAAAVTTDYAGNKTISWSWTSLCSYPGGCPGPTVFPFAAGQFDATYTSPNPYVQAMLAAFDAADRAAILAYDPFFDPPGRDPATIPADPRFKDLGSALVSPSHVVTPLLGWAPCIGTLTDAGFQVMAEIDVPFGAGESLLLQHSVLSTTAACKPQVPALTLATTTQGCEIAADVFVDTMFGTLLILPTSVGSSCSTE